MPRRTHEAIGTAGAANAVAGGTALRGNALQCHFTAAVTGGRAPTARVVDMNQAHWAPRPLCTLGSGQALPETMMGGPWLWVYIGGGGGGGVCKV